MRKLLIAIVLLICVAPMQGQAAVPCVQKYVTYDNLTQGEFDALVDFTFNVGCGNLEHSTLLRKLNAGDVAGAANEFGRWIYDSKKHVQPGLVRRRAVEKSMFLANPNVAPQPPPAVPSPPTEKPTCASLPSSSPPSTGPQ